MYFEISQRVTILNQRAVVLSDVLGLLNEHLSKKHGEHLEWVVIMLVFVSVVLAGFTIYIKVQLHVG